MKKKLKIVFPVFCWILLCVCIPMKVSAASVSAVDTDGTERVFRLSLSQPGVANMSRALFAVWGDVNDQDDLIWYPAQLMSDGSYQYDVVVSDHGQTGGYTVHAYAEGTDGSMTYLGNTAFKVSSVTASAASAATARSVTVSNYNASGGTFQAWVQGIQSASGISQVQIPVWCASDQSDIRWYNADRMSDGSYMAEITTASHGYHSGTYQIHAYVRENNGNLTFVGGTTQEVSASANSGGNLSISERDGGSSYRIDLSGVQISGLSAVQFAVWAEPGDQDDLKWYNTSRASDGSYTYTVRISDHGQTGTYNVHAYAILSNGTAQMLTADTFQVASAGNASAKVQVTNVNQNAGTFDITVSNASAPGGVQLVQVPVWQASDQSDIMWYTAQSQGNGTYKVSANVANHNYHTGTYNIHVYVTSNSGARNFVCSTTADIKANEAAQPKVQVSNVNESAGTFDIIVSNASAPGGVQLVQVPVWQASDQSDIMWYNAQSQGNGTYKVSANVANHNNHTGTYNIHVYVTSSSGTRSCVCVTTADIKASSQSGSQATGKVQASRINDSQYRISLSAPGVSGSNAKVLFPTWSVTNDQDDLIWYEGVRSSDGVWYVDVDGRRHSSSGKFITHAYIEKNGQTTFVGDVSYTLSFSVQTRVAGDANGIIGSITNSSMDSGTKLRTCYNWVVNNLSYETLPIPLEPSEPGYTQEELYAIYGMEQRRGNCYCYAAAFAAMARQLGYSATMISGSVPLLSGGMGPHAWVEIYMNGATYVCDPESQHENPSYGFYMTTYATAPYPYQK